MSSEPPLAEVEAEPRAVAAEAAVSSRRFSLHAWIVNHDDSWAFTLIYGGTAVYLSVWISVFWLVAVVGVHAVLEWVRWSHLCPGRGLLGLFPRVALAIKLDLSLVVLALAMAVYLDAALGLLGLGGAGRLTAMAARGASRGARSLGWIRAIRGVLFSLDDVTHATVRAVKAYNCRPGTGAPQAEAEASASAEPEAPWKCWGTGGHVAVWMGLLCLALIALAPLVLPGQDLAGVLAVIAREMQPFPAGD